MRFLPTLSSEDREQLRSVAIKDGDIIRVMGDKNKYRVYAVGMRALRVENVATGEKLLLMKKDCLKEV